MSTNTAPAVSTTTDRLGGLVGNHIPTWIKLGNLETKLLALGDTPVKKPVYVCGLARSGTTMLLEMLASHPDVTTHRYRDFPFLFTPYWWNLLLRCMPSKNTEKRERAHGDRILINEKSPEAMEEMLWMAFFDQLHSGQPEVLTETTTNPDFERFYREHIQKLLHGRQAKRYCAKGNYNVTRLAYLHRLFPDARFIVPVREPESHIVSLMRQHERFCKAGKTDPRAVRHMALVGHFEFGLARLPIHTGDDTTFQAIDDAWVNGEEIRGWSLLWDSVYRFVHEQLERNPALKAQTLLVRYEDLCASPMDTLRGVYSHADLNFSEQALEGQAKQFKAPNYPSPLNEAKQTLIRELTADTAALFGY